MEAATSASAERDEDAGRRRGLPLAFGLTWLSYGTYYFGRKGLSVAKATITDALGKDALVGVETAYLAAYAVGQYLSGTLGDRVGARRLVGLGMLVSAIACAAFGLSGAAVAFAIAFAVNGLAQSTGWPGNVKAMAEWTTPKSRGVVMGFWATCYQVGGIAATSIAARFLVHFGWRGAFLGPAAIIAAVGVLVLVLLRPGPGLAVAAEGRSRREIEHDEAALGKEAQRRVLRSPTVWFFGASYFCMKLIRYSFIFWLPFYLEKALGYPKERAADLSNSFEIGGVVGTIALGLLSDRFRGVPRSAFAAAALVGHAGALYLYAHVAGFGQGANFAAMALAGALLFGPDALISGAAAQDAGGPRAAALAAGIVNAVGSVGAVLQEAVTRGVTSRWGWTTLFYVFIGLALAGAACLVPTLRPARAAART